MNEATPHENKNSPGIEEQVQNTDHTENRENPDTPQEESTTDGVDTGSVRIDEAAADGQNNKADVNEDVMDDGDHDVNVEQYEERIAQLEQSLKKLEDERNKIAAAYSRIRADLDNVTRRKNEEIERLKKTAAADFVKQLLPVVDNLERAAQSAGDNEGPLADGVRLVLRQFDDVFRAADIQPVPGVGEKFDPKYHEAVEQVDADDVESGTIVEELQRGYALGDTVLRPSMVRVAQ